MYRLHESLRKYELVKLGEGRIVAMHDRFANHFAGQVLRCGVEGRLQLRRWLAWKDVEIDNMLAALRWYIDEGTPKRGADVATGLL